MKRVVISQNMEKTNLRSWTFLNCIGMGIAVCLMTVTSTAASVQEEPVVVTQHQIQIGSRLLKYSAEVGRIAIRDVETGEPHGYMFYTAYRVPSSGRTRPVTFLWNGGPGANSSLLHFYVAGPKLVEGTRLIDNVETWLTVTDLVFVDPVGTGFSRPTKTEYGAEFYGTLGDAASVTEFVRCWLLLHDEEQAPVFLVGESWGARRAAQVGYDLEKRGIRINGLVLISGGTGLNTEYCPASLEKALRVDEWAMRAQYFRKTPAEMGTDPETLRKAADSWARQFYAPALEKAANLSDTERNEVISQLARWTGMPANQIDRKTLTFTPHQFLTNLLKDEGKTLRPLDTRKTITAGTTSGLEDVEAAPAIVNYLRRDLGYRTDLPYVGLESLEQGYAPTGKYPPSVGVQWNYATAPITPEAYKALLAQAAERGEGPPHFGPPLPATEEAIALNPRMKVLVASGIYDSYASCAVNQETARHLPPALKQSMSFKCYLSGHEIYLDPQPRIQLTHDVEALIEANSKGL